MLRIGLTGELGSGKSTVARMLAERGAIVLSSDEMGRAMMEPGEAAYAEIVERFGRSVVRPDGSLDRGALAKIAFDPDHPRIEELNAIIHPRVIAEQARRVQEIERQAPDAIVVIESALIFSTRHTPEGGWRERFDCIVLVTAPDGLRITRFVERMRGGRALSAQEREALAAEARRRIEHQRVRSPEAGIEPSCLFEITNDGSLSELEARVDAVWPRLQALGSTKVV